MSSIHLLKELRYVDLYVYRAPHERVPRDDPFHVVVGTSRLYSEELLFSLEEQERKKEIIEVQKQSEIFIFVLLLKI